MADKNTNLLEVYDLKKHFPVKAGIFRKTVGHVKAVDGISFTTEGEMFFDVAPEIITRMRELEAQIKAGNRENEEEWRQLKNQYDIHSFSKRDLRAARSDFQMMFQDPFGSLNPRIPVGDIIAEGLPFPPPLRPMYGQVQKRDAPP